MWVPPPTERLTFRQPQVIDGLEEIELGYHVHPDFQRQGFATEAATAVLEYARSVLSQPRIVAIIDPRNEPSKRVALCAGLCLESRSCGRRNGPRCSPLMPASR